MPASRLAKPTAEKLRMGRAMSGIRPVMKAAQAVSWNSRLGLGLRSPRRPPRK